MPFQFKLILIHIESILLLFAKMTRTMTVLNKINETKAMNHNNDWMRTEMSNDDWSNNSRNATNSRSECEREAHQFL